MGGTRHRATAAWYQGHDRRGGASVGRAPVHTGGEPAISVDLSTTLSWTTATGDAGVMLGELQPNILKAHVRDHLSALLLGFGDAAEARAFLVSVTGKMKSAKQHLEEAGAFKEGGAAGTPTSASGSRRRVTASSASSASRTSRRTRLSGAAWRRRRPGGS